jgi:hypothetical protein
MTQILSPGLAGVKRSIMADANEQRPANILENPYYLG